VARGGRASAATPFSCIAHHARWAKGHRRLENKVRPRVTSTASAPATLRGRAGGPSATHAGRDWRTRQARGRTGCPRDPAARTARSRCRPPCSPGSAATGGGALRNLLRARRRRAMTWPTRRTSCALLICASGRDKRLQRRVCGLLSCALADNRGCACWLTCCLNAAARELAPPSRCRSTLPRCFLRHAAAASDSACAMLWRCGV